LRWSSGARKGVFYATDDANALVLPVLGWRWPSGRVFADQRPVGRVLVA